MVWIGDLREGEGEVVDLVLVFLRGFFFSFKKRDCRDKEKKKKQGSSSYTIYTNE